MSGHNKWSSIKHKKGAADAKRGKIFTRIVKEIILAARDGGGDLSSNPRLRTAVQTAKGANMPKDNIEKAIKRGTGEIEGAAYEEVTYEGYGHNGVALIIEVTTDNKNRSVAEIRHCLSKYGGNLAESGAVAWNFERKGSIEIKIEGKNEDDFMMQALDFGADDIKVVDDIFYVYTAPTDLYKVSSTFEENGYTIEKAELTMLPKNIINADDVAEKLIKLIDKLEDLDDVQNLYANFEISDDVMNKINLD
ncbi:MAG: YebC/PmpR family DNA-binding transcriptional regulator [Candidatus Cloacimonetes bacterium]|nr:YebC/PmpR family DNA-binding transcriptional regulator [Candidatus Cloacimonadota bacterium]